MKVFDQYQGDAFGRRVTRDYQKMSGSLRRFFLVTHYVNAYIKYPAMLCLAVAIALLVACVSDTWLFGGGELVSSRMDLLISGSVWLASAFMLSTVIPGATNFLFSLKYHAARAEWKANRQ